MADAPSKDPARIRAMFGDISGRYDFMNSLMTAGRHHAWRRAAAREAAKDLAGGGVALDACAGTGDFAIAIRREAPGAKVVATDFSGGMLSIAKQKSPDLALSRADTLRLPFRDAAFASVTIGWGARNLVNLPDGLRELARVLRPGGRLHILESSQPRGILGRLGFRVLCLGLFPSIARLFGKPYGHAYRYLPNSMSTFPEPDTLSAILRECGFTAASWRTFAFGGVTYHTATRQEIPCSPSPHAAEAVTSRP